MRISFVVGLCLLLSLCSCAKGKNAANAHKFNESVAQFKHEIDEDHAKFETAIKRAGVDRETASLKEQEVIQHFSKRLEEIWAKRNRKELTDEQVAEPMQLNRRRRDEEIKRLRDSGYKYTPKLDW